MGIFDRMSKLIKSNANAKIDKMSDPAKELEQLVLEMEQELKNARAETAKMMATEKRAKQHVEKTQAEVEQWTLRAEQAVRAGDDGLAKAAIERKMDAEERLGEARREHAEAAEYAAQMQESLKSIDQKLRAVKMKKGTLKAKIGSAKNVEVSADSLDDFERIAGKVDDAESEVEANEEMAELDGKGMKQAQVERKFAELAKSGSGDSAVEDRLAALKAKMQDKEKKE